MRGEWVALRRPVGGRYERIGGFGYRAWRGADVRAQRYTRVIPDADTHAFRGG